MIRGTAKKNFLTRLGRRRKLPTIRMVPSARVRFLFAAQGVVSLLLLLLVLIPQPTFGGRMI